jgi:hypothetical protein
LRPFLKLDKSTEGMIVHEPYSSDPNYPLKEWDVITRVGNVKVDNQGMIKGGVNLRVRFGYMLQKLVRDGKLPLTIVRAGKEMQVELPVLSRRPMVIPSLDGAYPPYFVYGPLVFSTASAEFVAGLARRTVWSNVASAVGSPLVTRIADKPAFKGEALVVIASPFFPHRLAKGYSNPATQVVKTINDVRIRNLDHLVQVLRDSADEFITIAFDARGAETIVFPRAEMLAATDEILTDNGVRSQGSPDMLAIWNAKAAK